MEQTELKRKAAGAFAWTVVRNGLEQGFGLIVFLALARMLAPEHFGLVAIATVVIEALRLIAWSGLPETIIRATNLTDEMLDTAFWASVGIAAILGGAAAVGADRIALLFDYPELAQVVRVMAIIVMVSSLGVIHMARLTRDFGHKALAVRALAANLAGGVVGITVAVLDGGVWALVAQRLTSECVQTAAVWIALRWRPRLRFSFRELKSMLTFGAGMTITGMVNVLNVRIQEAIAGLFLPPAAIGYLRIGNRLVDLAMQMAFLPAHQASLPSFARLQSRPDDLARAFLGAVRLSALVAIPSFLGLAAIAPELVPLVLGPRWAPSIQVLQVLCLMVVPLTVELFLGPLLVVAGRSHALASYAVFKLALGSALSVLALSNQMGIVGVAGALAVREWVCMPISLMLLRRFCGIRLGEVAAVIRVPLAASAAMAATTYVVADRLGQFDAAALTVPAAVLFGILVYLLLMTTLGRSFTAETMRSITPIMPEGMRELVKKAVGP